MSTKQIKTGHRSALRRYQLSAKAKDLPKGSADFQSAVSQNSILQGESRNLNARVYLSHAGCKPAIQQVENLRYGGR